MRKVIRGYAKDKNLNLVPIGTIAAPHARINALRLLARIKDIWSDKEQRSLRKKLFVSGPDLRHGLQGKYVALKEVIDGRRTSLRLLLRHRFGIAGIKTINLILPHPHENAGS